jgi:hypothetical protein
MPEASPATTSTTASAAPGAAPRPAVLRVGGVSKRFGGL